VFQSFAIGARCTGVAKRFCGGAWKSYVGRRTQVLSSFFLTLFLGAALLAPCCWWRHSAFKPRRAKRGSGIHMCGGFFAPSCGRKEGKERKEGRKGRKERKEGKEGRKDRKDEGKAGQLGPDTLRSGCCPALLRPKFTSGPPVKMGCGRRLQRENSRNIPRKIQLP